MGEGIVFFIVLAFTFRFKITLFRVAGELAQSVSVCHKTLKIRVPFSELHKDMSMLVRACLSSAGKMETGRSPGFASQSSSVGELQVKKRFCLQGGDDVP